MHVAHGPRDPRRAEILDLETYPLGVNFLSSRRVNGFCRSMRTDGIKRRNIMTRTELYQALYHITYEYNLIEKEEKVSFIVAGHKTHFMSMPKRVPHSITHTVPPSNQPRTAINTPSRKKQRITQETKVQKVRLECLVDAPGIICRGQHLV